MDSRAKLTDAPQAEAPADCAVATERAARKHNWIFAVVCGVAFVGTAAVNLAVDPFRVYHDAWERPYARPERYLVPGLIYNTRYGYDAITVGTSHSGNFQPKVIDDALGWKTMRATLDGSTIPEQLMVVRAALAAGRVKHVLWGVDFFATQDPPERAAAAGKIPVHLYERNWRTPFNYLVSAATLRDSIRTLQGRGERDLAQRGAWFEEQRHRFGPGKAVEAYPAWLEYKQSLDPKPVPEIQDGNVSELVRTVRDNPHVEFVCLLPPISVLAALPEHEDGAAIFAERVRFRRDLFNGLVDLPNCRLYDFEQADQITHNLALYKDPTHYGQEINDWMVSEIAADRCRMTRDNVDTLQAHFQSHTARFVADVAQPSHPLYATLGIENRPLAIPRLPTRWAEAEGPIRR